MALTRDEEQRQLIFQVAEHHCGHLTVPLKRKFAEVDHSLLPKSFETVQ